MGVGEREGAFYETDRDHDRGPDPENPASMCDSHPCVPATARDEPCRALCRSPRTQESNPPNLEGTRGLQEIHLEPNFRRRRRCCILRRWRAVGLLGEDLGERCGAEKRCLDVEAPLAGLDGFGGHLQLVCALRSVCVCVCTA